MHLLYFVKDPYPTARPDVLVLFGQRLAARGITSDVVATAGPAVPAIGPWPAGREFVASNDGPRPLALARAFLQEWRLFSRPDGYDAMVFRDKTLAAAVALLIARRGSPPIYFWMSYPFPEDDLVRSRVALRGRLFRFALKMRGLAFRWLLYRFVVPRSRHVFVQSEKMLEAVSARSGRHDGLTAIPMGVDESMLTAPEIQGRARRLAIDDGLSLVYLGSLDRTRNIDFLLHVLIDLRRRESQPTVTLTLVGGASSREEFDWLVARIRDLGLTDCVTLTGPKPMREAWQLCRRCHIGLSAIPRGELFDVSSPTKTVEYLALALPVVVNDIPDQELLIRETGAGLCVPMTVPAFADAIEAVRRDHARFAEAALAARGWVAAHRGYDSLCDAVASVIDTRAERHQTGATAGEAFTGQRSA